MDIKPKTSSSFLDKILSGAKQASITGNDFFEATDTSTNNPGFKKLDLYKQIQLGKSYAEKYKISIPYFRRYDGIGGATIRYGGQEYINFSSYNYINLNGHPEITRSVAEAAEKYGTSVSASRLVSGEREIHNVLEKKLADFYGTEASLAFVSGHATNVSVISCILSENDLIIYDQLSHNSILEGVKASHARAYSFNHNDISHLSNLLKMHRHSYRNALIVTEGVFSMDGDVPDLKELIRLKNNYRAFLMVDEAHSLGVLGANGKGISEYHNCAASSIDIIMGTLSKSLCSCGGYIAGNNDLIEILKYFAPGFVYSVGMTPMNAAAAASALDLLSREPGRVRSLQAIGLYFLEELKKIGADTGASTGIGIIPVIMGGSKKAVELSNTLFQKHNINVNAIVYPAVEENKARLRFFINSNHTTEQIDYVVSVLRKYV